ncbi:SusC/RagA family TonB-linked outer membrane protein [Muricauda sp. SCSIO 64092]|uniref:SusC/RagA family TonB-linked outer membrane protein n=1 Tax=Allomuricauda sp. SCSIO 64092 TaxID=2908842 RepID=UPI001FF2C9F8|nr:SusC/RagA family TonB-linked outer membrane protein [Muricauda sp. SCSIO 64092]UOY05894.1 SusC/RagA family TonB-linked outer membrane protein [Muricauda sp. SCSIO 64092]
MNKKIHYLLFYVISFSLQGLFAQSITVSGTVTDDFGTLLPGVNVVEKGTINGTSSDFDGNYTIEVTDSSSILVFSYIGFTPQEVVVGNRSTIDISLVTDTEQLGEVVVTALGIKREKKALGYSVQEISGGTLLEAREVNVVNAISGRVAGLQVIRGSNGPAGSSNIVLRGNNSLTGDNQPLIVVDGVPINNFSGADNNDFFNPSEDLGNGLGDINPDDIESMTVLKGASAAALYGTRAGNGVILITTKTGAKKEGLGITFRMDVGFQNIFIKPELQDSFGQGSFGILSEDLPNRSRSSWGPRITGQTITDWKGDSEEFRSFNNLDNFYETGFNQTYNLSLQQQLTDGTSIYSSVSYLNDESIIPGAEFERLNLLTRAVSRFGPNDRWTTDIKVQFINAKARNRPLNGNNINNAHSTILTLPRSVDINDFRENTDEFGNMIWYVDGNAINPYWAAENNIREDSRDRFLLNGYLKYQIADWMHAEFRGGADLFTNNRSSRLFAGSPPDPTGRYGVGKDTFLETNYTFMLVGSKDNVVGKFGTAFTLGGQLMSQRESALSGGSGELEVPNLFSLNNGINPPSITEGFGERKINSLFGSFQLNYDGFFFIDVTGRNDWSSTLGANNRSFFYPSISTSFAVTELFDQLPKWLSFAKLRASYAEVGNDLGFNQLGNFFNIGQDPNGNTTAGSNDTLNDANLVNELIKSSEIGFDTRFFGNRLGIDFSWYRTNATNQLLEIPIDPLSGFRFRRINAGDIQNEGVEVAINARIFDNPEGFSWDMNLNYARNRNTIGNLFEDVEQFRLGGFDNLAILAVEGGDYGEIWGSKFARVEDESSPFFNQIIVDENGIPLGEGGLNKLGDQQPDALIGFTNTFAYRNFSFGFLIDARLGGEIFSGTNRTLLSSGAAAATVVNGAREDIVFNGVVDDGNGGFVANEVGVEPQVLYQALANNTGNLGINEAFVYDATHIRVRNITMSYRMPSKWLKDTGIQSAKIGMAATNVLMLDSNLNGVDPESVFALSANANAAGFENLSPPTVRNVILNLTLSF